MLILNGNGTYSSGWARDQMISLLSGLCGCLERFVARRQPAPEGCENNRSFETFAVIRGMEAWSYGCCQGRMATTIGGAYSFLQKVVVLLFRSGLVMAVGFTPYNPYTVAWAHCYFFYCYLLLSLGKLLGFVVVLWFSANWPDHWFPPHLGLL